MARKSSVLGPDGEPLLIEDMTREIGGPTIAGVRQALSSHPSYGLEPQGLASILLESEQGDPARFYDLAADIEERETHYRSVLGTRKLAVQGLPITIEPVDESAEAVRHADLIREVAEGAAFAPLVMDLLDGLSKGISYVELIWETSERDWRPVTFVHQDPKWFRFDRVNHRTPRLLDAGGKEQDLAPFKWLVHQPRTSSLLPIRCGLARPAVWAWMFKNFAIKDWAVFLDVYGIPFRIGRYPNNATREEKSTLLRAVADLGSDAAAIIPETMTVEFQSAGGGGSGSASAFQGMATYWDHQLSKLVLGQTTTADAVSGGHAVSKEHNEVRGDIERADARQLSATLMAMLFRPIIDLNHGPQAKYPTCTIGRPEEKDAKLILDSVARFVPMGLKVEASQIYDVVGLKEPAAGAELLLSPRQASQDRPVVQQPEPDEGGTQRAAEPGASAEDRIDDAVGVILEEEGWAPDVDGLAEALAKAATIEEATAIIADHLDLIGVERLAERLAQARFTARVAGEHGVTLTPER